MRAILCFMMLFALSASASAAEDIHPSRDRCEVLVGQARITGSREKTYQRLKSESVQECFNVYPELAEKYLPVRKNESSRAKDPAFTQVK